MNVAVIIGGSSGIGLSITLQLSNNSYDRIIVIDKKKFPQEYLKPTIEFRYCDLTKGDYSVITDISEVNALFITSGFGHLSLFKDISISEINDSFSVNAISIIHIIHYFYEKLSTQDNFICAIVSSIAGRVCSPMFSIYSATKAALSKCIEAINIELEMQGSPNRILEVSPGRIDGTSFYGKPTDIEVLKNLSLDIIQRASNRETLYIPQYDEIYHNVIERYNTDSHQFGIDSFFYKCKRK